MRGMFVEGKLLKGDILVSKTNNTPAYPTPFIKIRQEEGFWEEGCPGFGPTQAWLWTRDHTGPRALKQNKWIQTLRQLAEWEAELALCLTDPPRPFFYWEPDSTSSAPWLPHEFSGLAWRRRGGPCRSPYLSSALQKKAGFCFVYMRWVSLQWRRCHYRSDSIQLGL